jgi:hypothetical protein
MTMIITLKGLTIIAALLAGGSSLAMAQNGLPTGGEPPVAGGGNGNPAVPGFNQAPGAPGYGAPAYIAQPGYLESGPAPSPGRVHAVHHRNIYMYAPPHRTGHAQKIAPNGGY